MSLARSFLARTHSFPPQRSFAPRPIPSHHPADVVARGAAAAAAPPPPRPYLSKRSMTPSAVGGAAAAASPPPLLGDTKAKAQLRRASIGSVATAAAAAGSGSGPGFGSPREAEEEEEEEVFQVAPELASLIYLETEKWPSLDDASHAPSHAMSSHEEVAASKLADLHADAWRVHNLAHLSRVYPAPARVDSSNPEPQTFWDAGVQLVALNFQSTQTLPMQLNAGLFRANGGSGYVLKPPELRHARPAPAATPSAAARRPGAPELASSSSSAASSSASSGGGGGSGAAAWDEARDLVTLLRIRLVCAELLPLPGEQRYEPSAADGARDLHPQQPEAARLMLEYEPLMPYVTVEVVGGAFGGAARSVQSMVHGSRYRSDYACGGFAPVWNDVLEAASSHPAKALLRVCVWHRRVQLHKAHDELVGVECVPLWALRPGYRALRLRDVHASRIRLAKLVVHIEARRAVLPLLKVRQTYHQGEQERRHKQVVNELLMGQEFKKEAGFFGFAKRKLYVSEGAGILRLQVKRLGGGDAPALVSYSTEDGTAQAGFDYEPQSGQLLFRKGVRSLQIKIQIIDDDEIERDKYFSVKLDYCEGGALAAFFDRARVTVMDDDLLIVEHIKRSYTYSAISAASTLFALVGNDLLLFLPPRNDQWVDVVTLCVFGLFCVDICLSLAEKGWRYALSVRMIVDVFATFVMLFSVTFFLDYMMATVPESAGAVEKGG